MDKVQQFTALMHYAEEDPGVLSRCGEIGKAMLEQIEQACLLQDAEALSVSIDGFLDLLAGSDAMRGFTPVGSQKSVEQFNSVRKATRSVLDKIQK
jgi:hypothetical protein